VSETADNYEELLARVKKIDRTQGLLLDAMAKSQASLDQLTKIVEDHDRRLRLIEAQLRGENDQN